VVLFLLPEAGDEPMRVPLSCHVIVNKRAFSTMSAALQAKMRLR